MEKKLTKSFLRKAKTIDDLICETPVQQVIKKLDSMKSDLNILVVVAEVKGSRDLFLIGNDIPASYTLLLLERAKMKVIEMDAEED